MANNLWKNINCFSQILKIQPFFFNGNELYKCNTDKYFKLFFNQKKYRTFLSYKKCSEMINFAAAASRNSFSPAKSGLKPFFTMHACKVQNAYVRYRNRFLTTNFGYK